MGILRYQHNSGFCGPSGSSDDAFEAHLGMIRQALDKYEPNDNLDANNIQTDLSFDYTAPRKLLFRGISWLFKHRTQPVSLI